MLRSIIVSIFTFAGKIYSLFPGRNFMHSVSGCRQTHSLCIYGIHISIPNLGGNSHKNRIRASGLNSYTPRFFFSPSPLRETNGFRETLCFSSDKERKKLRMFCFLLFLVNLFWKSFFPIKKKNEIKSTSLFPLQITPKELI